MPLDPDKVRMVTEKAKRSPSASMISWSAGRPTARTMKTRMRIWILIH
jgi:hypothetical protein